MKGKRRVATFLAIGLVLAGLATVAALVLPQTSQAASTRSVVLGRGFPGGGVVGDSYLAEALGITQVELDEAQATAAKAAIQQALDEGLITQAQADALLERKSLGARWLMPMRSTVSGIDNEALLADALGITTDELQAAQSRAADARLEAAVADGRITQEQLDLQKAWQALRQFFQEKGFLASALDQAVAEGIITQEQADTFQDRSGLGLGRMGRLDGFGFGFGPLMDGRGGMRHGGMGLRDSRGHRFELEPSDEEATPETAPSSGSSSSATGAKL